MSLSPYIFTGVWGQGKNKMNHVKSWVKRNVYFGQDEKVGFFEATPMWVKFTIGLYVIAVIMSCF